MSGLADILAEQPCVILDGAFATELEKRGCDLNDPLWSAKVLMEQPELIAAVHQDYFNAGADCTITASYQATYEGFMTRGLSEAEAEALIVRAVSVACQARDDFWQTADQTGRRRPLVAASVGPYGAFLADGSEYRGNYALNEDQLVEFHRRRFMTLATAGADLLACETIPCFAEAMALARLLSEVPQASAWISFTARDGLHTRQGEKIRDCSAWLDGYEQVEAIGINCTEPRYVSELISEIRAATQKPIVVYPNSGEIYDPVGKSWFAAPAENFAMMAREWFAAGARIIGGCCRTGPNEIRAIRHELVSG